MSGLLKNLLFALGLAVILWVGYTVFLADDDAEGVTEQEGSLASDVQRDTQEFLSLLNQLKGIEFDDSFFSDPAFRSLQDFRKDLVSEPVGRTNPFDPA